MPTVIIALKPSHSFGRLPMDRGAIHCPERYKQLIDYSGLQFERKITPTDIDGFLEFGGDEYIYLEYKLKGKDLPYGQRLAFTRKFECLTRGGGQVLGVIAEHEIPPTVQIPAHLCSVKETWISPRGWRSPNNQITVLDCIVRWRKYWRDKAKIIQPNFPPELQDLPLFQIRKTA